MQAGIRIFLWLTFSISPLCPLLKRDPLWSRIVNSLEDKTPLNEKKKEKERKLAFLLNDSTRPICLSCS